jgi:hypothetical protein
MCPILVVAANTSNRNMLTGCLEAWGAEVFAAIDQGEAETYRDGNLSTTVPTVPSLLPPVTAILYLSLRTWWGGAG